MERFRESIKKHPLKRKPNFLQSGYSAGGGEQDQMISVVCWLVVKLALYYILFTAQNRADNINAAVTISRSNKYFLDTFKNFVSMGVILLAIIPSCFYFVKTVPTA